MGMHDSTEGCREVCAMRSPRTPKLSETRSVKSSVQAKASPYFKVNDFAFAYAKSSA